MDSVYQLYVAFFLGMASIIGVFEIVRVLPFEEYFKTILRIVLPIPPVLIALVMVCYGPVSYREAMMSQSSPGEMVRTFIGGAFSGMLCLGVINVLRMMHDEE